MFESVVRDWRRKIFEEGDHHEQSAEASTASQEANDFSDAVADRAGDDHRSHMEVHHDVMDCADKHGDAEAALLKAAVGQHRVGNHELAGHLFNRALDHRSKRHDAIEAAAIAHEFHRTAVHGLANEPEAKGMWDEESQGVHPSDEHEQTAEWAEKAGDEADHRPPHDMGHSIYHQRAAKAQKEAMKSAEKAAQQAAVDGQPANHDFYKMLSRVHAHHERVHKEKAKT